MTFKEKVYNKYLVLANDKVDELKRILEELKETASNETKSTAGDKHETALAMIQIEQKNKNAQLSEALAQKQSLEKLKLDLNIDTIINGSLIKTNKGFLFLSVALGRVIVDGITVISLSAQSPLGTKLLGLKVADTTELNGTKYFIENIE